METAVHQARPVDTGTLQVEQMDSLRRRWNAQMARMNGDKPGIEGLLGLTQVSSVVLV
jgi:hypothetical protein